MRDQIARLAEANRPFCVPNGTSADEDGDTYCRHCGVGMNVEAVRHCGSQPDVGAAILAEFDRLSKIEAAAKTIFPNIQEWAPCLDETSCDEGYGNCPHCEAFYDEAPGRGRRVIPKKHREGCPYTALYAALAPSTGKSEKPHA